MTSDIKKEINRIFNSNQELKSDVENVLISQNTLNCLWHRKDKPGHKGNFGLMGECLDCMKEIEQGRCTIDVQNFDFNMYWTVRNFWIKVDIKEPNECWRWLGATKKNGTETSAYMPSPFHAGGDQSATRVAFWTSRGYVGRHRILRQRGCDLLCCNPLHLRLSQLVSIPAPTGIEKIQLSYGHLKDYRKDQSSTANELSPD